MTKKTVQGKVKKGERRKKKENPHRTKV